MVFGWFRKRRRRRLLAHPFPDEWERILEEEYALWPALSESEQARLKQSIQIFVPEKNWEGCGGLQLTEEMKVLIAAQACLLGLGFDDLYFDHVLSILVYPDAYLVPNTTNSANLIETEGGSPRMGEAWWQGPVILSWRHALAGARDETDGENLVLHEFAHQLDMLNGRLVDGTPPLENQVQLERWIDVMTEGYQQLIHDCRRGNASVMSCYGTTNVGEFFAVATESFFCDSLKFQSEFPAVYEVLAEFYKQDPARRRLQRRFPKSV